MDDITRDAHRRLLDRRRVLGGDTSLAAVQEIDAALERIAAGLFGLCQRCARSIGRHRLLAAPETRTCSDCTSRID
ncbi:MAG: hypothetical protein JST92_15330 [Deltaproteobacteria bacterium]|nr:hypothetical protein [Deltaproteobacteria bacterium]